MKNITLTIEINSEGVNLLPTAKATMVEWFLVKKYLWPALSSQVSFSEIWWYPADCNRFLASSEKGNSEWMRAENWEIRERREEMVITDGVESGRRCVEEVDQIGDDGVGAFFLRHVFRGFTLQCGAVLEELLH